MKAEDLKTKTVDELQKLLLDTRKGQFNMRFQRTNGQMENTSEIRKTRRTIARIKTFLNAKLREEAAKASSKKKAAKVSAANTEEVTEVVDETVPSDVTPAKQIIDDAVKFGATSAKIVIQGKEVNFTVGAVGVCLGS